jgi:hypothetical protein
MPPNPNSAAISAMTRKVMAHPSMAWSLSLRLPLCGEATCRRAQKFQRPSAVAGELWNPFFCR